MDMVVSLIADDEHVPAVRNELVTAGIAESKMSVLRQPADVWQQLGGRRKIQAVAKKAAIGALIGLAIGALYGVPAAFFNCTLLNCPLRTGMILAVLITLFWILGGGLAGAIVGLDGLEYELYSYVEGVRRGEALIVVSTTEKQAPEAVRILRQEQGTVIHEIHEDMET